MTQWVYSFGAGAAEGSAGMADLLGGKGANLAEMSGIGLPVPPGFTVTTGVCTWYYDNGRTYPDDLAGQVAAGIAGIENIVGRRFGDPADPLLVSVRSGARASMPGMMDTVLNLGLNDETVRGLAESGGDARFAWDSYRRFIQMYGAVVLDVDHDEFERELEYVKERRAIYLDTELGAEDLEALVGRYKEIVQEQTGAALPQDPNAQLWGAIGAVFGSWMNARAVTYRRLHDIPEAWGTAVNVQAMVFGNMGEDCATGVAFTRDPSTGDNRFFGEFLVNAQGEDVVAGIRTPQNLTVAGRDLHGPDLPSMEEALPEAFAELVRIRGLLERHYRDMQDIEFTVQRGRLWMLQTRSGKRSVQAALKIAVDMVDEGILDPAGAIEALDPAQLDQLLHPTLDPAADVTIFGRGLAASPGAATGAVVFSADEAVALSQAGEAVVLVRVETSPEDIHGMHAAAGILTTRGGATSHAAVVARGMGRPCVCGAGEIRVDYEAAEMACAGRIVKAGERITIDGASGRVMLGEAPLIQPELSGDFARIMEWADDLRRMAVRTNAETPAEVRTAREFGAEGIGLCRTEHMFFDEDRIVAMREMILADDAAGRRAALEKLLPMQRRDFAELFGIMAGLPVTIRLLDPPLHEFLPHGEEEHAGVAEAAGVSAREVRRRIQRLSEANPMLGHRGCRLAVTFPEICEMQARAIFEAAAEVQGKTGRPVAPEVMIPLAFSMEEVALLKAVIDRVAAEVAERSGVATEYLVGTMIELPRAALQAGEIAREAAFFSFGTNDLTQTTFGLSRDDAGNFLPAYVEQGIVPKDPFVSLDVEGVGELVRIACDRGRAARPDLKLGICGEHGGDPASIAFCEELGLDYVSCSPYRVPIARLAAAQARLRGGS
ncbi:MAG: pyruvate, phosphate dikinase [Rhodospirillaceae bacterium]|nr:pyruvate, phosphate dikinase [Rhodospirillaceae bacterium]MYB12446.1 pyruvate, phosphate dikinase [Rhodospirillaceae bacterium]MYI51098.1 pyruvate, phosphate dikinase [Rhodospirillaceae bacterium]